MKVVGLTGGIATGKSLVTITIRRSGVPVIDCDEIAHAVTKQGRWGYKRVLKAFGTGILKENGDIDRDALGQLVFNDENARRKLNRATHPAVTAELAKQLMCHFVRLHWLVVVDMPLLFETGAHLLFRPRVLVECDPQTQVKRLMERDGCSRELAESKIAAQMPLALKRRKSQHVIQNSGTKQDTEMQVGKVLRQLKRGLWWQGPLSSPATLVVILIFAGNALLQR